VKLASQTITFPSIGKQLVGTQVSLLATASSGLPVSFTTETPATSTVTGSTASLLGTGTCIIQASQAGSSVYDAATTLSRTIAINLASQTITFTAIAKEYVGTQLGLSATASSGLAVSFTSETPAVCELLGSSAATFLTAGSCSIQASQAGNSNYAAAPLVTRTFNVVLVNQTITFTAISKQLVGAQIGLSAGASSGLAVSFASTTPSVCSVSGTTASMLAAGTCTIQASQGGSGTYAPAPTVNRNFTVVAH
jgi:hypothetical protein